MDEKNTQVLHAVMYIMTASTAMLFAKSEWTVFAVHAVIVLVLMHTSSSIKTTTAVMTGFVLSVTCYVCVVGPKMWTHSFSTYPIPVWMPLTWTIVAYYILDVHELMQKKIM